MGGSNQRITEILAAGDRESADELMALLYDELRALAHQRLAHEPPGQPLQTTALVHEAYLRLIGDGDGNGGSVSRSRAYFFAAAAEAMRRIVVEQARRRRTRKRGGDRRRITLEGLPGTDDRADIDLLALDDALKQLEIEAPRQAEIILLRYFAGLSVEHTASVLDVTPRTIIRNWRCARAWLYDAITGNPPRVGGDDDDS